MSTSAAEQEEADEEVMPLPFEKHGSVVCRTSLKKKMERNRMSFTTSEFSFVTEMLEEASDDDLQTLQATLEDENLFFDPLATRTTNAEEDMEEKQISLATPKTARNPSGSSLRKSRIEQRKSCKIQSELWNRASCSMDNKSDKKSNNLLSSIEQVKEWALQALDEEQEEEFEDQDDEKKDGEKPTIATAEKDHPVQPDPNLVTRMASVNLYRGQGIEVGSQELFELYSTPQYDPWDEATDRSGQAFEFKILGTSQNDDSTQPHILSPPIMYALQSSLPYNIRGESFWLKYSLVRDGANLTTFLQNLRASSNTLMAMETVDGEVFGAFTSSAWTIQPSYYGGNGDSFLWRMKHSRDEPAESVLEQAQRETDLEIFPNTKLNPFGQICRHDKLSIGGGTPSGPTQVATGVTFAPNAFGFGIAFEDDYLLEASSSACLTFDSPPLSNIHDDGSKFELLNLEVWAFTPCITLEEARRMDFNRLFLKRNATSSF